MKRICMSEECTRPLLEEFFVGNSEPQDVQEQDPVHCCHQCDLKLLKDRADLLQIVRSHGVSCKQICKFFLIYVKLVNLDTECKDIELF